VLPQNKNIDPWELVQEFQPDSLSIGREKEKIRIFVFSLSFFLLFLPSFPLFSPFFEKKKERGREKKRQTKRKEKTKQKN